MLTVLAIKKRSFFPWSTKTGLWSNVTCWSVRFIILKGKHDSLIQYSKTQLEMGEKVKHFIHKQLLFNLVTEGMTQSLEMPSLKLVDQCCVSTCILYNHTECLSLSHGLDPICCSEWISPLIPEKAVWVLHLFLYSDNKLFIFGTCWDIIH